jgi:Flp pilus assembly protein TadB
MLVLVTALLVFEAVGAGAVPASPSAAVESDGRERKASDPSTLADGDQDAAAGVGRTWSIRLVWGVVTLGWWMLFMTAIWFHTWLEKWSGLTIALSTIYVMYILPRRLAPWRDIIGLPGV